MTSVGRMAFKVKCLMTVNSSIEGELTNEIVKEGLSARFIVPEGPFNYLDMLDEISQYSDFDSHVTDALDEAIEAEQEKKMYLKQIKASGVTLQEFKQSFRFSNAVKDIAVNLEMNGHLLDESEVLKLFEIQPVFSEMNYEFCIGALDSRFALPFLGAIANELLDF